MALAHSRPIEGAVATLGVSERVAFLRRTYAHLAVALIGFALVAGGFLRFGTELSWKMSVKMTGGYAWLGVLAAFMVLGYVADWLARHSTSKPLQYLGLTLAVVGEGVILQPLLWVLFIKFGNPADFQFNDSGNVVAFAASGTAMKILMGAIIMTVMIFVGLTATVFITKKDFSFMRGFLVTATFAAMGVIVASILFGFTLGAVFSGAMILLMSGYILYQTSLVMQHFPPTHHVAAALMLFSTIATLFWYVLQLIMSLAGND